MKIETTLFGNTYGSSPKATELAKWTFKVTRTEAAFGGVIETLVTPVSWITKYSTATKAIKATVKNMSNVTGIEVAV